MGSLNPGGHRGTGPRVFGAENIRRACQEAKGTGKGGNSIATGKDGTTRPHAHSREQQRRLKQEARRKVRQGTEEQPWCDPMPETPMEGPQ